MEYLATFPNQLQAMEYARALTRSGIPSRMMPRPRAGGQLRHGGAVFQPPAGGYPADAGPGQNAVSGGAGQLLAGRLKNKRAASIRQTEGRRP